MKSVGKRRSITKSNTRRVGPDGNLFDFEFLQTYYETREHEIFFRSIHRVEPRRAAYPTVAPILEKFIATFEDEAAVRTLGQFVFRDSPSTGRGAENIAGSLRKAHPKAFELLRLPAIVDFDVLKNAYRQAALENHPDRGGTTKVMQVINDGFAIFHNILAYGAEAKIHEDEEYSFELYPKTAQDYYLWVGLILSEAHLDHWSVDEAFDTIKTLKKWSLFEANLWKQSGFQIGYIEHFRKLTIRLVSAKRFDAAKECFRFLERRCVVAIKSGLQRQYFDHLRAETTEYLDGKKKPRVIIKHLGQLENAFRLEIIDEKRYFQLLQRLSIRKVERKQLQLALVGFARSPGFTKLEYDMQFFSDLESDLVPTPDYFSDRLNHLSKEQRAEYFKGFSPDTSIQLVMKYLNIRLGSLRVELVHNYTEQNARAIEAETVLLQSVFPDQTQSLNGIAMFASCLRGMDVRLRTDRLKKLAKIDDDSKLDLSIAISVSSIESSEPGSIRVHSITGERLVEICALDDERFRRFIDTGSEKTDCEQAEDAEVRKKDMNTLDRVQRSKICRQAEKSVWGPKREPAKVISKLTRYVDALYSAGNKMSEKNLGELQLPYWVDQLTWAYEKIGDWPNLVETAERLFKGSPRLLDRGTDSVVQEITRRLTGAKIKLKQM